MPPKSGSLNSVVCKDVYIAYGKTEAEARAWLRKNGWEPLNGNGDFNAGKASKFDDDVAATASRTIRHCWMRRRLTSRNISTHSFLYSVKSERKGFPILADSLVLQYGSNAMPEGCSRALHMFTFENATDLGDTAYSFNNDKNGVYFFWDVDEDAFKDTTGAASSFSAGPVALSGGLGLLVGIIGTAFVMRRRKEQ